MLSRAISGGGHAEEMHSRSRSLLLRTLWAWADASAVESAQTRYAKTADGLHIAYQVIGSGPVDMIYVPPFVSHVEMAWEWPAVARSYRALAGFSRLLLFDKRGTGMSDRVSDDRLPDLDTRMDDVRAVMDAAGSERAVIVGVSDGAPMSMIFAATYPERTLALVLIGGFARARWAPDYPWGVPSDEVEQQLRDFEQWVRRRSRPQFTSCVVHDRSAIRRSAIGEMYCWNCRAKFMSGCLGWRRKG